MPTFPLAELEALYMHIFSVSRMYGINISFKHNFSLRQDSRQQVSFIDHRICPQCKQKSSPFGTDLLFYRALKRVYYLPDQISLFT